MKSLQFRPRSRVEEEPKKTFLRSAGVIVLLILLMEIVAFVAYSVMMKESLRLDEAQSIWQTSHSLGGTLEIVAQDVHMPMYHVLLHYWMILFGTGVETVRTMSLIFFLACIPVLYLLSRTLLSRGWSLVVVALFALSPFMNWYANEARMYTLLTLFALLSQYFFVRILQGKQGWGGYAITAILGAFSHYFFMFTLIAQAIFFLLNRSKFKPGSLRRFILTAIGVGVAISPWIYYFIAQGAAGNTRPMLPVPSTVDFFNVFSQFIFGFQTDAVNTIILSSWPILVIGAFFTVKRRLRINRTVVYLLAAGLLPIVLAYALSFIITPFFLGRYMMPAVAPLILVTVWLVSQYPKKVAYTVIGVWVAVVGALFVLQMTSPLNPVREDYRSAAEYIDKHATVSDAIVLTSPFTVYPFEYYYNGNSEIRTLPLWNRQDPGGLPPFEADKLGEQVDTLREGHDRIYLLVSHDQGYEDDIVNYLTSRYERTEKRDYSEDMTLYVYKVGYNPRPVLPATAP